MAVIGESHSGKEEGSIKGMRDFDKRVSTSLMQITSA